MSSILLGECGTGGPISTPLGSNWIPPTGASSTTTRDVLEALYGDIDESFLAQSLKAEIAKIEVLKADLLSEIASRLNDGGAFALLLSEVEQGIAAAQTYMYSETQQRSDADSAVLESFNVMAAALGGSLAALVSQVTLISTTNGSTAQQITQLSASLASELANVRAAITTVNDAAVTRDNARASQISQVAATFSSDLSNVQSLINVERNARASADSSLASQIGTVQSTLGTSISQVQTNSTTIINSLTGTVNALYTAKVNVNGLIGGFGLSNNGVIVDAGFDVDRFWVGRTTANKVKPFAIRNGVTEIESAVIGNASIGTLKIANNAVTVPMSKATLPGFQLNVPPVTTHLNVLVSGFEFFESGQINVIVTVVTAVLSGSAHSKVTAVLQSQVSGTYTIFDIRTSMAGGFTTAPSFSGTITVPHSGNWRVVIHIGNDAQSFPWICQGVSMTVIGTKR
jgi:hypothetical protein